MQCINVHNVSSRACILAQSLVHRRQACIFQTLVPGVSCFGFKPVPQMTGVSRGEETSVLFRRCGGCCCRRWPWAPRQPKLRLRPGGLVWDTGSSEVEMIEIYGNSVQTDIVYLFISVYLYGSFVTGSFIAACRRWSTISCRSRLKRGS